MSADDNRALVRRFLEVVAKGWTPDVRRYLNPHTPPLTREGQRARASRLRAAFPDGTATLEDLVAEGDRVVYRLTIRGTHRAELQGIPATGRRVLGIVRIADGKLVEEWGGLDLFDLRDQLQAPA